MDELTRLHLQNLRHRLAEAKKKLRSKKLTGAQHDSAYKSARELRAEVLRIAARYGVGTSKKKGRSKRK